MVCQLNDLHCDIICSAASRTFGGYWPKCGMSLCSMLCQCAAVQSLPGWRCSHCNVTKRLRHLDDYCTKSYHVQPASSVLFLCLVVPSPVDMPGMQVTSVWLKKVHCNEHTHARRCIVHSVWSKYLHVHPCTHHSWGV